MKELFGVCIAVLLLIAACTPPPPEPPRDYKVDKKYCVASCRSGEFGNFHHGTSLGGSSSMNGLTQTQIYDRVTKECEKFFTSCCEWNNVYGRYSNIVELYGYHYGECK